MGSIRAQVTTRSGPPGSKDVQPVVHGDHVLGGGRASREFTDQLRGVLEAARALAGEGMVTEVAVLIYPDALQAAPNQPKVTVNQATGGTRP